MSNVLKVKVAGQRIRYQVSKVIFSDDDLLKATAWRWDDKKKSFYPNDNKLDITLHHLLWNAQTDGHFTLHVAT